MAVCHSVTRINSELVGDPLEVKMLASTGWEFREIFGVQDEIFLAFASPSAEEVEYRVALTRRFDFTSKLQRMSVVVKNLFDNKFHAYVKGSPEMIRSLSTQESIPIGFDSVLEEYTKGGFRVIALAHKELQVNYIGSQKITREEVE